MMFLMGVMRGADLQNWAAVAVVVSFFLIGLPLGAYLGLMTELRLLGVWLGNFTGLTCASVAMAARIYTISWQALVDAASQKAQASPGTALIEVRDDDEGIAQG